MGPTKICDTRSQEPSDVTRRTVLRANTRQRSLDQSVQGGHWKGKFFAVRTTVVEEGGGICTMTDTERAQRVTRMTNGE